MEEREREKCSYNIIFEKRINTKYFKIIAKKVFIIKTEGFLFVLRGWQVDRTLIFKQDHLSYDPQSSFKAGCDRDEVGMLHYKDIVHSSSQEKRHGKT